LEKLDLKENCIWDLEEVREIGNLPFLTAVYFEGNPISFQQVNNYKLQTN